MWNLSDAQQLAIKLVHDPRYFDLSAWLRIGDPELNAPDRVTMTDIAQFLKLRYVA